MTDLLPCPFCGGGAIARETITDGAAGCNNCGVVIVRNHGRITDDGQADAIAAWNTRAATLATWKVRAVDPRMNMLASALDSIARNTCCDGCQEAALVAQAALAAFNSKRDAAT